MNKKVITIIGADNTYEVRNSLLSPKKKDFYLTGEDLSVFDGSHTFEELYEHRYILFIALCRQVNHLDYEYYGNSSVWRSKTNGDGTIWDGWFVMGIGKDAGKQITYHLPLSRWEETDFANTLDQAPEFDGHSSQDVLERLKQL